MLRSVRAALEGERRVGLLASVLQLTVDGNVMRVSGELPTVEAKRRAAVVAASALPPGMSLSDRLRVRPFVEMEEDEIRRTVCHELSADSALQGCAISSWEAGRTTLVSRPRGPASGQICVTVMRDAVRLDGIVPGHLHRRVAEVMAWWSLGARSVDNTLAILPEQPDGDEQLEQALWYVLHNEPLLHGARIEVSVREREAKLCGTVPDGPAREIAEYDAWFVPGVVEVHNQLVLQSP